MVAAGWRHGPAEGDGRYPRQYGRTNRRTYARCRFRERAGRSGRDAGARDAERSTGTSRRAGLRHRDEPDDSDARRRVARSLDLQTRAPGGQSAGRAGTDAVRHRWGATGRVRDLREARLCLRPGVRAWPRPLGRGEDRQPRTPGGTRWPRCRRVDRRAAVVRWARGDVRWLVRGHDPVADRGTDTPASLGDRAVRADLSRVGHPEHQWHSASVD